MLTIYQAGPLFSEAEQLWHLNLKSEIEKRALSIRRPVRVIWPYQLFDQDELQTMGADAPRRIFEGCRDAITESNLVIALLDGTQVDDGTAWELGYAYAKGISTWGVRTDFRSVGDCAGSLVNAMIEGSCERIFRSIHDLLDALEQRLKTTA